MDTFAVFAGGIEVGTEDEAVEAERVEVLLAGRDDRLRSAVAENSVLDTAKDVNIGVGSPSSSPLVHLYYPSVGSENAVFTVQ